MKIRDFDFQLPPELIAQTPAERRDHSRLMVVDRKNGEISHRSFRELPGILGSDDLLVLNDSRVFPARLLGHCGESRVELLLIRELEKDHWQALGRPGKRLRAGARLEFARPGFRGEVTSVTESGLRLVKFEYAGDFWNHLEQLGTTPLPPYIRRPSENTFEWDSERYQTVFARERGSVAAPTAGLHFTKDLLVQLPHCFLTLHVGYGTFKPVSSDDVEEHKMEPEFYRIPVASAASVNRQKVSQGRVVAVGSTATRVLEQAGSRGPLQPGSGWTSLYVYPGFEFRVVDALITNFHLPRSTLLLLVSAFAGEKLIRECYRVAIEERYRFYSYGDAMLIV